jgi:hypothetical protein
MRDPAMRAALLSEKPEEGHPFNSLARNWQWMFPLNDPPDYAPPASASIAAQAEARGVSPAWSFSSRRVLPPVLRRGGGADNVQRASSILALDATSGRNPGMGPSLHPVQGCRALERHSRQAPWCLTSPQPGRVAARDEIGRRRCASLAAGRLFV